MTDQTPDLTAEWIDGDPLMEAIAAAVWEHCERHAGGGSGLVIDDPRTIAAWAAAVARAVPSAVRTPAACNCDAEVHIGAGFWHQPGCATRHLAPAADRAGLREQIAEALMAWAERNNNPKYAAARRSETVVANAYSRADAVLAVLPPSADRAVILDEAIERAFKYGESLSSTGDVRIAHGMAAELQRMAVEAQQQTGSGSLELPDSKFKENAETLNLPAVVPGGAGEEPAHETQARPPLTEWHIDSRWNDGAWKPWTPAYPEQGDARERFDLMTSTGPGRWPLRLIRATTTYAVEAEHQPAAGPAGGAQQPKEADNPRTVCVCSHTKGEHITVSGRLVCDACDPDSTDNITCTGFEAL